MALPTILIRNIKWVAPILLLTLLISGVFYTANILEDNGRLESELVTLEDQVGQSSKKIKQQERMIEGFLKQREESEQQQEKLSSMLSNTEKELEQCLSMEVPPSVLDVLFQTDGGVANEDS